MGLTPKQFYTFDVSAFDWFIGDVADHYEKASPLVVTWMDTLAERLRTGVITLKELQHLNSIIENETWMDAHAAGNLAYKQLSLIDQLPANVTIAF